MIVLIWFVNTNFKTRSEFVAVVCDCWFPGTGNAEVLLGRSWINDANGGVGAPGVLRGFVSVVGNWGEKIGALAPFDTDPVGMDRRAVPLLRQSRPYPLRRDGLRLNFKS